MDWTISVDFFIIETSSSSSNENRQRIVTLLKSKGYKQVDWDLKSWCTPGNDCTSNTVFEKDLDKDIVRGKLQSVDPVANSAREEPLGFATVD